MPRSQGFARGDLDTAFPLDDKFLELRGRLSSERYYAATGVYFHVVAACWREAERKVALRVVPDGDGLIDELVAVGLLDPDGRVPNRAFVNHIGRARRQRRASTERQARNRAEKSRGVARESRVTSRDTAPLRSVGTEGTDEPETGGAGGPDAAVSLHIRTGRFPSKRVLDWLDDLALEAGAQDRLAGESRLVDLIDSTPLEGRNVKDYLDAITDRIRSEARTAIRRERDDELERNAQKRQPIRIVPLPDDATPEEAQRAAAEWEAKYGRKGA